VDISQKQQSPTEISWALVGHSLRHYVWYAHTIVDTTLPQQMLSLLQVAQARFWFDYDRYPCKVPGLLTWKQYTLFINGEKAESLQAESNLTAQKAFGVLYYLEEAEHWQIVENKPDSTKEKP
jgi:hypothetical protein